MKRLEKAICLAMIFTVLFSFTGFAAQCEDIPEHVLRLHVLANSDSKEDQTLKLQVRDRILQESAGMLDDVQNKEDAEQCIREKLPESQRAAADEIAARGYDYPVTVELERTYFPTREYEQVTLPAGMYEALRVCIGNAEGHNWWCVIFPPMCLPAAEESQELEDVLDAQQLQIVEGQNRYIIKFKTLEYYEQIKAWLAGF